MGLPSILFATGQATVNDPSPPCLHMLVRRQSPRQQVETPPAGLLRRRHEKLEVERVAHKSQSFQEAEAWNIRQCLEMSANERMQALKSLKERLHPKAEDIRDCLRDPSKRPYFRKMFRTSSSCSIIMESATFSSEDTPSSSAEIPATPATSTSSTIVPNLTPTFCSKLSRSSGGESYPLSITRQS
jgi:hypothetical protein